MYDVWLHPLQDWSTVNKMVDFMYTDKFQSFFFFFFVLCMPFTIKDCVWSIVYGSAIGCTWE